MDNSYWSNLNLRLDHLSVSNYKMFATRLRLWLQALNAAPEVANEILRLEKLVDVERWLQEREATSGSMEGSAILEWPDSADERMGLQLALVRRWSGDIDSATDFASNFFGDDNYDIAVSQLTQQIIRPLAGELGNHLNSLFFPQQQEQTRSAPASDRTVSLDHNSAKVQAVLSAVSELHRALHDLNDYDDADDKAQRLAELEAGQALLKAPKTRLSTVRVVLVSCLRYLGEKLADNAIGLLITAALTALLALFGMNIL